MQFFIAGTVLFFLCIYLSSCKKEDFSTLGVIPESEVLGLHNTDTATVISFTIPDDSIRSDETSMNLVGIYNDPVFGTAEASIFTQVRLPSENQIFDISNIVIDSVILSIAYNGIYGNNNAQGFKIFELDEKMYFDSSYYSTKAFNYKPAEIGSVASLIPNTSDSTLVGGQNEPPQMRILLNNSVGLQLLKTCNDNPTNALFLEAFKGIFIKPDYSVVPVSGNGAIMYVNLQSTYSGLTVYYQDTVKKETSKFKFIINENAARLTNFNLDHSGTPIFSADSFKGSESIFIQSMAGAKGKIKLPFLGNFVGQGKVAVNKAELIFNLEENSYQVFAPHEDLFLVGIDSTGGPVFILDQLEGADHYGGTYNSSTRQYVFTITRHVQYLLSNYFEGKNYNYGLYLMAGGKAVNSNRTILKGNKNSTGALKLKISYTPL